MNIVTSYMRKWVRKKAMKPGYIHEGPVLVNRRYEYFRRLAFFHKDLIAKHVKTLEVEEAYALTCVRRMPLRESYDCKIKNCPLAPNNRYKEEQEGSLSKKRNAAYGRQDMDQCLECWTQVLEDASVSMGPPEPKPIPAFLAKKQLPSFLKKK